MDSITSTGTNGLYERKDLASLISLQDGPIRPLLQGQTKRAGQTVPAVGTVPAKGKTHYWDEQALVAPTGATAGYQEGGKPLADFGQTVQVNNVVGRNGKVAAVTDTMAAVWTGAGSYTLQDGELERLYREALDFDVELKTTEVLNELEYIMIQGNSANNTAASIPASPSAAASAGSVTSQFNGLLEILGGAGFSSGSPADGGSWTGNAVTNYGSAQMLNAKGSAYGSSGTLTEQMIRDAARIQRGQKTPYVPDVLLCTSQQQEVVDSFRPSIITLGNEGLTGGGSVDYYNTGVSKVSVLYEPWLPAGYMILGSTQLLKRAPLIELGAEPLARVQTQVERMITCEMSLELRVQKSWVVIFNLAY